jgi:hypothetical protein
MTVLPYGLKFSISGTDEARLETAFERMPRKNSPPRRARMTTIPRV